MFQGRYSKPLVSLVCATWLCTSSELAGAIGFGKPLVNSSVGEPLRVTVPLVFVKAGELDDLSIGLASRSWYSLSGIDYPEIARQIILTLDQNSAAQPSIVISTLNSIDQVLVPLMIELKWPQKVLRKQVTALINPRGYAGVNSPLLQDRSDATNGEFASGEVGAINNPDTANTGANLIATTSSVSNGSESSDQIDSGNQSLSISRSNGDPGVVEVKTGDSLSEIVDRYLPAGANRYQGRMAFYNLNKAAFDGGDIHRLTSGARLVVPTSQAILDLSASEAKNEYVSLAKVDQPASMDSSTGEDGQGGFRLSLLEVPKSEDSTFGDSADSRVAQSGTVPDAVDEPGNNGTSASAVTGQDFEMQGFSLKMTVLNAYIVELQDENRQLAARVENLERRMEELIRLSGQQPIQSDVEAAEDGQTAASGVADPSGETQVASVLEPLVAEGSIESGENESVVDDQTVEDSLSTDQAADGPLAESQLSGAQLDQAVTEAATEAANDEFAIESTDSDQLVEDDAGFEDETGARDSEALALSSQDDPEGEQTVGVNTEISDSAVASGTDPAGATANQSTQVPRVVYRDQLISRAKSLFADFNTPIVQLLLAILLLGVLLLAWMLWGGRGRNRRENVSRPDDYQNDGSYSQEVGVTFDAGSNVSTLDMGDDDPWLSQQDISEKDLENMPDSDVDLFTQSEVYLAYNRPLQAVQALLEEYEKPDSDKFVVAARILKVYEKMGDNEARNSSLANFIVVLNRDIEVFSADKWDALRFDLDALRKNEQLVAVDHSELDLRMTGITSNKKIDESPSLGEKEADDVLDIEIDFPGSNRSGQ